MGALFALAMTAGALLPANSATATTIPTPSASIGDAVAATVHSELNPEELSSLGARASLPGTGEQCEERAADGTQVCVTLSMPNDVRLSTEHDAALSSGEATVGARSILPMPTRCLDDGLSGYWSFTRTDGCAIVTGEMWVTDLTSTGAVVETGTMTFNVYWYVYALTDNLTWASQVQVSPVVITGTAAGTMISLSPSCEGDCVLASSTSTPGAPTVGGEVTGESYFTTTPAPGATATGSPVWDFTFSSPGSNDLVMTTDSQIDVRCDDALPGAGAGCVLPYVVGRITYSGYPQFGAHVSAAQASGLPGKTVPLHRTTNDTVKNANRAESCKTSTQIPRNGLDCDEYPFASTYEGAAAGGPGRTFSFCGVSYYPTGVISSTGFSICLIDPTENRSAGSLLNSVLFVPYRIIDGDPFYVAIS